MHDTPSASPMPPAMILCGGKGTRLRDITELLPKPMVPIGDYPIVWHIMHTFAAFGVNRFILCLGYKEEAFIDYFLNFRSRVSDFTITLGDDPKITYHTSCREAGWEITLAHTGVDTTTGGRVLKASAHLAPTDTCFFLTYGDGVADLDISRLYALHRRFGKLITVSAVHPEGRFGNLEMDGDDVVAFVEKADRIEGYINGGYMVVEREAVGRYLEGRPDQFFEQYPMRQAAIDRQMKVYRHESFWQCMDNPREYQMLNQLWNKGKAPWTTHW